MNNKWFEWVFLSFLISPIAILWMAISPVFPSGEVPVSASDDISDRPALSAELPSRTYVLNNYEIVTEMPLIEVPEAPNATNEPTTDQQEISYTVRVILTVLPSRLIVVDENDKIFQIWSNTNGKGWVFYSLNVSEQHLQEQEHPLTPAILDQYNSLLDRINWDKMGKVYPSE